MSWTDALSLKVDRPFRVLLKNIDGEPWADAHGCQAYIDVVSYRSSRRAKAREYIAVQESIGRKYADATASARDALPFYVVGWYLLDCAGNRLDVECTVDNARKLFAEPDCDYITTQATAAMLDDANYFWPPTPDPAEPDQAALAGHA